MDRRRILNVLLKLGLATTVMVLLVNWVGWNKAMEATLEAELPWLMSLCGVVLLGRGIEAIQMRVLLGKLHVRISVCRIFLANALSSFYSLVVPGDVIASAAKWSNLSAATGKKSLILNAIVYNRIALLTPVLAVGTVALAIENPFAEYYLVWIFMLCGCLIMGLGLGLFHPTIGMYGSGLCRWLTSPFPQRIQELVEHVLTSLEGFREFRFSDHLGVYAFSILALLINVSMLGCATHALGLELSALVLFWVSVVLIAARQVPLTVGNIGVQEGLLIVLLGLYGVEPERALAVGFLLYTGHLFSLIGLLYQLALSLSLARSGNSFDLRAT